MKIKKSGVILMTGVLFFSIDTFSQTNNEEYFSKKAKDSLMDNHMKINSLGLEVRLEGTNSPNIGMTYRRYFKESKYNLKASFFIGGNNANFFNQDPLLFPTSDSTFIGVTTLNNYYSNYQRLEVGLEKKATIWKLDFVVGADLILGHRFSGNNSSVFNVTLQEREQNGLKYYKYDREINDSTGFEDINYLQITRNHLIAGAGLNLGMFFDISPRLYASAMIGLQFYADFLLKENFFYKNELYKEHLPTTTGISTFNFNQSFTLGLHYRF